MFTFDLVNHNMIKVVNDGLLVAQDKSNVIDVGGQ